MPPVSNEGVMEYGEPITAAFEAPPEVAKVAEVAVSLFLRPEALNSVPFRVKVSP